LLRNVIGVVLLTAPAPNQVFLRKRLE